MNEHDLSKCHCEKAGFCSVFNMEMGISPPNFSWCQSATEEQRLRFLQNNKRTVRKIKQRENFVSIINFFDELPKKSSEFAVCVIPANDSAVELLKISRDSIKSYAEKCGADYIELTGDQCEEWPIGNKYRLYQVTSKYEKTVFFDCDMIIKDNAPNLFKITPNDKIAAYDEWYDYENREWISEQYRLINKAFNRQSDFNIPRSMINSGLLVIPKSCCEYYKQPEEPYPKIWCFDQQYLTQTLPDDKFFRLDRRWNHTFHSRKFWKDIDNCYVYHINGEKNQTSRKKILECLKDGITCEYEMTTRDWNLPEKYDLPDCMDDVEIVTVHYNATQSKRLTHTYKLWMESLKNIAPFVKCYELVFDDREPEIPGSIVIRGSLDKHCLWQKESLLNLAFKGVSANKKYFLWIDHDCAFRSPSWLTYAVDKMKKGFDFVQLFNILAWTDNYGGLELLKFGRCHCLQSPDVVLDNGRIESVSNLPLGFEGVEHNTYIGNPGLAWGGRIDSIKKIGDSPWPNAVVGSGDEYFCMGLVRQLDIQRIMGALIGGKNGRALKEHGKIYSKKILKTVDKIARQYFNVSYCPYPVFHIWHGDNKNRQYVSRHNIITECKLDLDNDIFINDDGIYELVEEKQYASKRFYKFFLDRKED